MAGNIDSGERYPEKVGRTYLDSRELDFRKQVVGVYFPEIIKGDEIGILYNKDGIVNTAIIQQPYFTENYEKIPLEVRDGIKSYALRTIDYLKEENADKREDPSLQLNRLTKEDVRKRNSIFEMVRNKSIELKSEGVEGSDRELFDMAIEVIGKKTINKAIGDYGLYFKDLVQQAKKPKEELNYLRQQTEELNKLQKFYQAL